MGLQGARVLVTGGAGFVGSHLTEILVRRSADVTVVDNLATGRLDNLRAADGKIHFKNANFEDPDLLYWMANDGFDFLFHLAANAYVPPSVRDPWFDFRLNLMGTLALLENLRKAGSSTKFVFASSAAVYGNPVDLPICEQDLTVPISPYGVGKLAAERYVDVFAKTYEIRSASARLFSVFGPRQRKQVVYDIVRKLHADPTRLTLYGDGTQERDLIYVTNAAEALVLIAERGEMAGEVYNVASGASITIRDLAWRLASCMGADPVLDFAGQVRAGDPDKWLANIDKLTALGFSARVSLEQGLRQAVDWYMDEETPKPV
jgi:UDP-glucose 4-epimerase